MTPSGSTKQAAPNLLATNTNSPESAEPVADYDALPCRDALGRTAAEACRQHERLARLIEMGVANSELAAAHAMVDMIDLALEETVQEFERKCAKSPSAVSADVRQSANTMWLAARQYLKRHSMAERASRQIRQGSESLNDLHFEYELEASALLALKQATNNYQKLRPASGISLSIPFP